MQSAVIIHGTI